MCNFIVVIFEKNQTSMNTETENKTMEIAKTIISQIKYADRMAMWAWGVSRIAAISESKEFAGGVEMVVNGLTHKGWVKVQLRWVDDYTISFIQRSGEVVKKVEQVYCDMLVDILDWAEGK